MELKISSRFNAKNNLTGHCPICQKFHSDATIGSWLFKTGTWDPFCLKCAGEYIPKLLARKQKFNAAFLKMAEKAGLSEDDCKEFMKTSEELRLSTIEKAKESGFDFIKVGLISMQGNQIKITISEGNIFKAAKHLLRNRN